MSQWSTVKTPQSGFFFKGFCFKKKRKKNPLQARQDDPFRGKSSGWGKTRRKVNQDRNTVGSQFIELLVWCTADTTYEGTICMSEVLVCALICVRYIYSAIAVDFCDMNAHSTAEISVYQFINISSINMGCGIYKISLYAVFHQYVRVLMNNDYWAVLPWIYFQINCLSKPYNYIVPLSSIVYSWHTCTHRIKSSMAILGDTGESLVGNILLQVTQPWGTGWKSSKLC